MLDHEQFVIRERLGSLRLEDIDLRTWNPAGDAGFDDLISAVEEELKG